MDPESSPSIRLGRKFEVPFAAAVRTLPILRKLKTLLLAKECRSKSYECHEEVWAGAQGGGGWKGEEDRSTTSQFAFFTKASRSSFPANDDGVNDDGDESGR